MHKLGCTGAPCFDGSDKIVRKHYFWKKKNKCKHFPHDHCWLPYLRFVLVSENSVPCSGFWRRPRAKFSGPWHSVDVVVSAVSRHLDTRRRVVRLRVEGTVMFSACRVLCASFPRTGGCCRGSPEITVTMAFALGTHDPSGHSPPFSHVISLLLWHDSCTWQWGLCREHGMEIDKPPPCPPHALKRGVSRTRDCWAPIQRKRNSLQGRLPYGIAVQ